MSEKKKLFLGWLMVILGALMTICGIVGTIINLLTLKTV
jgi:hypothetical protein